MLRYPGSKAKLYRIIERLLPDEMTQILWALSNPVDCYCEPFVGSGAVAWHLLKAMPLRKDRRQWAIVGDMDRDICRLWQAVRDAPDQLAAMVMNSKPQPEDFERFKQMDGAENVDPLVSAYRKLVLHNTSWSGLGFKAGSVLGGKNQRSQYNHLCRWNPIRICSGICRANAIMKRFARFQVAHQDFEQTLGAIPMNSVAYLDPPYYQQGEALYKFNMEDADHVRLSETLRKATYRFLVSYDDHPRIRELYSGWARVDGFEMVPTIQRTNKPRRKNNELLISNF